MVDFIAANYNVSILFNYTPNQKEEAQKLQSAKIRRISF
jgi:hypothetical protein